MGHCKTSLVGWVRISAYKLRFGGTFQNNNFCCFPSHLGFFSEPRSLLMAGTPSQQTPGLPPTFLSLDLGSEIPVVLNIWPSSLLNKQVSFVPELRFQSWPGSNIDFLLLFSAHMASLIGAKQRQQFVLGGNWLCCLFLPWKPWTCFSVFMSPCVKAELLCVDFPTQRFPNEWGGVHLCLFS